MVFDREVELEETAIPFLNRYCSIYTWRVPLYNRVVDLAAIDKDGMLIGIEFKLRDWRRAINQALVNSNSFDFIYVCLPGGRYLNKLKEKAKKHGIGVMLYDPEKKTVKVELEAQRINRQWKPNMRYLKNYIKTRGEIGYQEW